MTSTHIAAARDRSPSSATLNPSHISRDATEPILIVVMGVSGTGKSTLGTALAGAMHLPFIDGDDLHPASNVAKMARGEPLEDVDRWPWLERVREVAVAACVGGGAIVACSSLKKTYRAVLQGQRRATTSALPVYFVYLKGEPEVLMARMLDRQGHFMKAGMLQSQLDALESPEGEPGVVTVSVEMSTGEQVQRVVETLRGARYLCGPMCTMNMLWNTQIIDTCIVFPSWHIRSTAHFVLSFVAIVCIGVFYEYLRLFQRDVDVRIRERVNKGRRVPSPVVSGRSTPERGGEDFGLLSGSRMKHVVGGMIPAHYRALRAVLYGASVSLSAFLMLVFMTYNAYLIFGVVAGATIGHYFFSGFVEPDSKGMACH